MGPDIIPDLIFAERDQNDKGDDLIKDFLTKSVSPTPQFPFLFNIYAVYIDDPSSKFLEKVR